MAGRRSLAVGWAAGLVMAMLIVSPCVAATTLETAVKATFLYKFAPFVDWPQAQDGPFHICVVGRDPFGQVLDQAVVGQTYGARPIQVVRMNAIQDQSPCDVAYLGGSGEQDVGRALAALRGAPVLTVTDEGDPAGIIQFAIRDGRVRFSIDQDTAAAGRLSISSKLLSLAVSVKGARR